jgi:hypothetical protein
MAHVMREGRSVLPRQAASAISAYVPVRTSASAADQVLSAASSAVRVLGVSIATAASPGDPVAVQVDGVAKCIAAASIGNGALLAVGSTNGRLIPVASGSAVQVVGESQTPAADGDVFSVLLKPANPVA